MKPQVKTGLIVGVVGLVANTIISAMLGVCGPIVALIAGAIAGFLSANQSSVDSDGAPVKRGAVAAALAGILTATGQLIGGLGLLYVAMALNWQLPFGAIPTAASGSQELVSYWVGGLLAGGCFGTIGLFFAVGAGALAAYLRTSSSRSGATPPPSTGPDQPA